MQCANLSFASDRFLFIIRRVASFHLGAGNSRLLLTDKFSLDSTVLHVRDKWL